MSDFETAARPYARAIFELASDEGKLQQWQDNLQQAAVDCHPTPICRPPSSNRRYSPVSCASCFYRSAVGCKDGMKVDARFQQSDCLLAENDRLAALPSIATVAFATLKQEAEGKIEVTDAEPPRN